MVRSNGSTIVNTEQDVGYIGICGMRGIGKTTLAMAVYNRFFHYFEGKCFLADVREKFDQHGGKVELQEQLLLDLLRIRKIKLPNIHEGVSTIKERLNGMRVLIVMDDVSDSEQLDALARDRKWFGPGSRIIITTRDLDLLKEIKADCVYIVPELNDEESLRLFSWHAFGSQSPREEFTEISREISSYCQGLPLALKVMGSYFGLKGSEEEWKSLSRKVREVPHNRVQRQLRISFDGLGDDKEKDLFLDIACFFIGFDRDYVVKILEACGLYASIGIRVLVTRCLLEVDSSNKLKMHDLIRDMGRQIVREKSSNPGRRTRLWFRDDVLHTLQNQLGTEEVEGIALNYSSGLDTLKVKAEAFSRMHRLRLLQLNSLQVTGDYRLLPKDLRWLFWHKFPLSFIPKELSVARLAVIDMQYSNLKKVWNDNKHFLGNLKVLNLSYSPYLTETPNFMKLPNLEELILRGCTNLEEVHPSIGYLGSLLLVNLRNCRKLKKIPSTICRVKSLRTLDISGCPKIKTLPENFGELECLAEFLAEGTGLTEVPFSAAHMKNLISVSLSVLPTPKKNQLESLFRLRSLRTLRLANCGMSDGSVLDGIGSLQLLENLDLSRNPFSSLPGTIGRLPKLEKLLLDGCTELESLPSTPPSLFVMSAANCISLKSYSFEHFAMVQAPASFYDPPIQTARAIVQMEMCENFNNCHYNYNMATKELENFLLKNDDFYQWGDIFLRRSKSDIPSWFDYQGTGPALSFQMPSLQTCKLKGVTICVIFTPVNRVQPVSSESVYKVTIRHKYRVVELTHRESEGRDNPVSREDLASYVWLLQLPHQIVFRDEFAIEGDVEIAAECGNSSLCVKRIGIHFGSKICRYCLHDSSAGSESQIGTKRNRSEMRASTSDCEFDLLRALPSRANQTLEPEMANGVGYWKS